MTGSSKLSWHKDESKLLAEKLQKISQLVLLYSREKECASKLVPVSASKGEWKHITRSKLCDNPKISEKMVTVGYYRDC